MWKYVHVMSYANKLYFVYVLIIIAEFLVQIHVISTYILSEYVSECVVGVLVFGVWWLDFVCV